MRVPPLAALAAATLIAGLLSGCTGYPPGAARLGDTVSVRYEAYDLGTGAPVSNGTTDLVLGTSDGGLGDDVAHALLGHRANDTVTVESRDDTSRGFTSVVSAPAVIERSPLTQTIPVDVFQRAFGQNATAGKTYTYQGQDYAVDASDGSNVTLRSVPGAPEEYPRFGLRVVQRVEGDSLVKRAEPMADPAPFQGPLNPILSQPGTYRARSVQGDNLTFDYSPATDPALFGHDLRIVATVLQVTHGSTSSLAPGERFSPIVGRSLASTT